MLRRLWGDDRSRYEGKYYSLHGGTLSVRPVQDPLPVWVATQGPRGMEIAGAMADGWISNWLYTPEGFGQALATVRRHAGDAGRNPKRIVGVFEAGVAVAETQAEAERHGLPGMKAKLLKIGGGYAYGHRLLQALGYQGPPPTALAQIPDDVVRACSIIGTPERVIQRIEEYARHGVGYFITTFMNPGGEGLFAKAVLPHFQKPVPGT